MSEQILTIRQMRAVEAAAMASGVAGRVLMARAGAGVAGILAQARSGERRRAVILCGPGNNGGDGYVVARLLRDQGWHLRVAALAAPATQDAADAARAWTGPVVAHDSLRPEDFGPATVCIDALFGTGLGRPIPASALGLLQQAAGLGSPIVAVDILSGVCADSGRVLGGLDLPSAALTVTFHRPKPGHLLAQGGELGGLLRVVDIGLEPWAKVAGPDIRRAGPLPALLKRAGHKYDHGHALILAGGPGKGGAARLAARAALRSGAGLVTLACPPEALAENAARLDAAMLRALPDAAALGASLRDPRLTALCLGPGLGLDRAPALVEAALSSGRPCVLDADALTAWAENPPALLAQLHGDCVLTPHGGEFARLFPDIAATLAAPADRGPAFSRLDAARLAAARAGCVLLLKGPDTVVAAPDGGAFIAAAVGEQAAPWLATAGSGDVLAGLICGLLARGFAPLTAAATAAWLHAEAARGFGPGLIAEDLPDRIPAVLQSVERLFPPRTAGAALL